jgi:hypothetical protein
MYQTFVKYFRKGHNEKTIIHEKTILSLYQKIDIIYMESIVLTDKTTKPNDDIVFSIIGNKFVLWKKIMKYLYANYSDVSEEWKFYNDGKRWLFRSLRKGKTIFWIGVLKKTFRISFWFGDKAEPLIDQSDLPENIKSDFRNAKKYNKIRSLSITMPNSKDVNNVIKLVEMKLTIK